MHGHTTRRPNPVADRRAAPLATSGLNCHETSSKYNPKLVTRLAADQFRGRYLIASISCFGVKQAVRTRTPWLMMIRRSFAVEDRFLQ
jgi:hypothetical protein